MFISELCKACGLTKKAIAYYEKLAFIQPQTSLNGYRVFTDYDCTVLKEVALLRKLGIQLADIKTILDSKDKRKVLTDYKNKMDYQLQQQKAQYDALCYFIETDCDEKEAAAFLDRKLDKTILIKDKLLQDFPGKYGLLLCVHFSRFLCEKIDSTEKEMAYYRIVAFLDGMEEFPEELEQFLSDTYEGFSAADIQKMDEGISAAFDNYDAYINQQKEAVERYLEYRASDEFKTSPMAKMQRMLLDFQKNSGYYDVFIPNLKILSNAYRLYHEKLTAANEKLVKDYPQAQELYQ